MPAISLMPYALEVVQSLYVRYLILMWGRGAGKTHAITARIKWLTTKYPKFQYMYIGPLAEHGGAVFKTLCNDYEFRKFIRRSYSRPYPTIELKNGSVVTFRSFQRPDTLKGGNLNEICLDESQDDCFTEDAVDTVIIPMLRTPSPAGGRGVLLMAGQFRGNDWRKTRYYDYGIPTLEDGKPNPKYDPTQYRAWRVPASEGYTYKVEGGAELYAAERARYLAAGRRAQFEQQYECIPCANQNSVYQPHLVDAVTNATLKPGSMDVPWPRDLPTVTAVDIAAIVDYSAVCVVDSRGVVVYSEQFPKQNHQISAERAAQVALHFKSKALICDATGGGRPGESQENYSRVIQLYREACKNRNLHFQPFFFMNQKQRVVVDLEVAMQQRRISIPAEFKALIEQLKSYEFTYNEKTKWYNYGAPRGQHDDLLSALLMAWHFFDKGWANSIQNGTPLNAFS